MTYSVLAQVQPIRPTETQAATENGLLDFGMSPQAFAERHFEESYQLFRGALRDKSFSWADVNEALQRIDPIPPSLQLFNHGDVDPATYISESIEHGVARRRIVKAKFYEHLNGGATAVMNRFENASLFAERLCRHVGRFAGHPTIGNAYLSFGGQGTFGKHWDTHDVFVIQLLGSKRWQVFAPTWPLPLSQQTSRGHESQCPTEPALDCELKAGDVLYLPRGWWHRVIPLDGGSFHLSVGTYAPTASDFLQWACQRHVTLSQAARIGLTGDAQQSLDVNAMLAELGKTLRDPSELAAFHRERAERERNYGEFDVETLVSKSHPAKSHAEWPDEVSVTLTSPHPPHFDGPNLIVNGAELRLESLRRALVLQLSKT